MRRSTLEALREAKEGGKTLVRAVDLASGEERLLDPGGDAALGRAAADAVRADRSGMTEVEGRHWFLEVHNPPLDLRIVGAVHIAQPLARMAMLADYRVIVIDPRGAFATEQRFPGVTLCHDWPDEALTKTPLTARSALVALAHDPKLDDPALAAALRTNCFYVGALGSKKTQAARILRLKELGFSDAELARIRGPVGLAIGARSPAEIAISILAEMTMRLRADGDWEQSVVRATADTGISPRS
ncbi:MAG TPA: XdhC family protein [Rhizomicrobium sp.]|jgi:xanthine dehydrogenase accessory factor|nr:XdhC family protein [Rhizomicrobium sp.]